MVPRLVTAAQVVLFALAAGQDIRGLGMGRLTLALESEAKPFDMYGFGGNPAGLYRSELPRIASGDSTAAAQTSVLELYVPGSLWRDAGEPPDEWAIGNPVPGQVQRCFPHYMQDVVFDEWYHETGDFIPHVPFAERPSGFSWRYRGAFALAVDGTWSYAGLTDYQGCYISTPELGLTAAVPLGPIELGFDLPASLTTNTWPYIRNNPRVSGTGSAQSSRCECCSWEQSCTRTARRYTLTSRR